MEHVSHVSLQKTDKGRLGFTVSFENNQVHIQRILPFMPAEGKLCVGDRILTVDHHPISTSTEEEAVRMIRNCHTPGVFTVSRRATHIVLYKTSTESFGFRLHSTPEWPLTIQRIQTGSTADNSPLTVADRVLMINHQIHTMVQVAAHQIRMCGNRVELLVF
jgi:hypothetical protein